MGVVYRATDTDLDREVALKIPSMHRSDATTLERFRREARAMATVSHRNLCPVYDAGEVGGKCFLSMACIRGRTLADLLLAQSPFSNIEAAAIVLKLAEAMDAAHAAGVVHCDLKSANIIMDPMHEPVITDFGLGSWCLSPVVSQTDKLSVKGQAARRTGCHLLADGRLATRFYLHCQRDFSWRCNCSSSSAN
jgi:serine/threonine protein kinase